jgi:hypothetical protein
MPTEDQCRTYALDCQRLSAESGTSLQRATALMAMALSWTTLANQTKRYDAIVKDETR